MRRRMMMGKGLPYDAEVEYLESTGTQYINTGVQTTTTWGVRMKYSTSIVAAKIITGNYLKGSYGGKTYSDNRNFLRINGSSKFEIANAKNASALASSATVTANTVYAVDAILGASQLNLIVNGTSANKRYTAVFNPIPILLFAVLNIIDGTETVDADSHRIYYAQYYNPSNGNLLADFIPVRVGQVGYMYDKVSGQLFGNAGTGQFILGPDK